MSTDAIDTLIDNLTRHFVCFSFGGIRIDDLRGDAFKTTNSDTLALLGAKVKHEDQFTAMLEEARRYVEENPNDGGGPGVHSNGDGGDGTKPGLTQQLQTEKANLEKSLEECREQKQELLLEKDNLEKKLEKCADQQEAHALEKDALEKTVQGLSEANAVQANYIVRADIDLKAAKSMISEKGNHLKTTSWHTPPQGFQHETPGTPVTPAQPRQQSVLPPPELILN